MVSRDDHNFPLPLAGLQEAREKYARTSGPRSARMEEMIGARGYVTGSVGDFSGRRKRASPDGFIVTNGRGTKICLIKTRRGQHSRALLHSAYGRGINLPFLLSLPRWYDGI